MSERVTAFEANRDRTEWRETTLTVIGTQPYAGSGMLHCRNGLTTTTPGGWTGELWCSEDGRLFLLPLVCDCGEWQHEGHCPSCQGALFNA